MAHSTRELPLVSVIVITYNSAKYVLETLESIKAQTYDHLELIVSDDGSKDDTVALCNRWIEENRERFQRAELLTVAVNTGIPANCNRGVNAAKASWTKMIAGDDILEQGCVAGYMDFIASGSDINFVSARVTVFSDDEEKCGLVSVDEEIFALPQRKQFQHLLTKGNFVLGPSVFFNLDIIKNLGGFDERYRLIEDYPLFVKIYSQGYRVHFLNSSLVRYRVHDSNVSLSFNSSFSDSSQQFRDEVIPGLLLKNRMYLQYWHFQVVSLRRKFPKDGGFGARLARTTLSLLSPVYYGMAFRKLFSKDGH